MDFELYSGSLKTALSLPDDASVHQVADADPNALTVALQAPLGLPQLQYCVVAGDRVTIIVDPETPQIVDVISRVLEQCQLSEVSDLQFTLLFPANNGGDNWKSIIEEIPVDVRNHVAVAVEVYDPSDELQRSYLATSAAGERIYLANHVIDADLIVTIGVIGFDAMFGYRGTNSGIYPAFSDTEAVRAANALRHSELSPDDKRPLRELSDEIGWLLGTQFSVQVIPDSSGKIGRVFCGAPDNVFKEGCECLKQQWQFPVDDVFELAVISVPRSFPHFGWKQFGAAVAAATQLVEDGGRIAVVADLPMPDSPAFGMLRRCNDPQDLLKPLRLEPTDDAVELTQLIQALDHSRIYLLSNLDGSVVEELGMLALSSAAELQRMIASADRVAVVSSANYAWPSLSNPA